MSEKTNQTNKRATKSARRAGGWTDFPDESSVWWWMHDPNENEISAARTEWRDEKPWHEGKSCWVTWLRTRGGMSKESLDRIKGCRFQKLSPPIVALE